MSRNKRQDGLAPPARDGVVVGRANTTVLDCDIDIVITGGLGLKINQLEIVILGGIMDGVSLEIFKSAWMREEYPRAWGQSLPSKKSGFW